MTAGRLSIFAAGSILALTAPVAAGATDAVTTAAVNIRAGAGVDKLRLATLPRGAPMSVDYCVEGWCHGSARGLEGWVSARYLSAEPEPTVKSYVPPTIAAPPAPPPKFPFVMPDRGFHDYGVGNAHKFQRKIK